MSKIRIISAVIFVATVSVLAGCGGKGSAAYKTSQGAPYELVVVADHPEWDGPVGDTLRAMFHEQFPMINRQETRFDVLRVLPGSFKNLIARHRNILIVDVDSKYAESSLELFNDVYATPQVVIRAYAPDEASMSQLIDTRRDDIMLLLEYAERERDVLQARGHTPEAVKKAIKDKFGFDMGTGSGFTVRSEDENFLWLSYEMPTSSQGIVIYAYPFSGLKDFQTENLLRRRNEFVARIPGEIQGSYMISNPDIAEVVYKKIDERQWAEMRGFWDVEGDFMGGPYVNYSTLDAPNQRVVAIDFYVYSPNPQLSQRNYIKQLEHYLYTVEFPALQQ